MRSVAGVFPREQLVATCLAAVTTEWAMDAGSAVVWQVIGRQFLRGLGQLIHGHFAIVLPGGVALVDGTATLF